MEMIIEVYSVAQTTTIATRLYLVPMKTPKITLSVLDATFTDTTDTNAHMKSTLVKCVYIWDTY